MKLKLLAIIILLTVICLYQGIFIPAGNSQEEESFLIERGQGIEDISLQLEEKGLIKDDKFFKVYVFLKGGLFRLQAGEYSFSQSISIADIANKIREGKVVHDKLTIPEGWNLRDIAWHLENRGMFQAEELFELAGFPLIDYSKNTELPQPKRYGGHNLSLEGYLFPDTYYLDKGMNLEEIIDIMLANFEKKLSFVEESKIFDTITMASLIEKEVKSMEDKKIVSGILWKRLKINMPLQVDATVVYITQKQKVSYSDTKIDSLYNTYKYKGLPLGPICNPGLGSITAALNPQETDYWYYLSTPEGETIFSVTLEEHNKAKAKYLK